MAGWAGRAVQAYSKREEAEAAQKEEDVKTLIIRVSCLLGEVIQPNWVQSRDRVVLEVSDGPTSCVFAFADEEKKSLALRLRCRECNELYFVPVQSLADLGRLFSLFHSEGYPKHPDCPKQSDSG